MRLNAVLLVSLGCAAAVALSAAPRHTMLMNRLGPSAMTLFIANGDGSGERSLFPTSGFDYNASFSPEGRRLVFTSARGASGQADLDRVHPDGSGVERLTDAHDLDDQGVISPDGRQLAFVSTRGAHTADVWTLDLNTHKLRNLTGGQTLPAASENLKGAFRPSWSADGKALKRVTAAGVTAGSPRWSPDGRRLVFYELDTALTFAARMAAQPMAT